MKPASSRSKAAVFSTTSSLPQPRRILLVEERRQEKVFQSKSSLRRTHRPLSTLKKQIVGRRSVRDTRRLSKSDPAVPAAPCRPGRSMIGHLNSVRPCSFLSTSDSIERPKSSNFAPGSRLAVFFQIVADRAMWPLKWPLASRHVALGCYHYAYE